jgi:hypothetical protein
MERVNDGAYTERSPTHVKGMMPDFFHVVPVGDDTVLNWVLKGQDTSLGLSFVTDIRVLLSHSNHDTLVSWSTDNGRENLFNAH